jgi:hypothetical protein
MNRGLMIGFIHGAGIEQRSCCWCLSFTGWCSLYIHCLGSQERMLVENEIGRLLHFDAASSFLSKKRVWRSWPV